MNPYYADEWITLYHGDCREVTEWLATDVLVTDPPYGLSRRSGQTSYTSPNAVGEVITGDESVEVRDQALALWGTRPAVVFGTWRHQRPARTTQRLIWHKSRTPPGISHAAYYPAEEEIYLLGSGWQGAPTQNVLVTNEWRATVHGFVARSGHPTPKPESLMARLIEKCPPGVVADPFAGSGSTLIAAKHLGRRSVGVEVEERYCELIARSLDQGTLDFGGEADPGTGRVVYNVADVETRMARDEVAS